MNVLHERPLYPLLKASDRQEEVKNTARILKTGRWNVTFPIPQKLFLPEFYFADLEITKRSPDY